MIINNLITIIISLNINETMHNTFPVLLKPLKTFPLDILISKIISRAKLATVNINSKYFKNTPPNITDKLLSKNIPRPERRSLILLQTMPIIAYFFHRYFSYNTLVIYLLNIKRNKYILIYCF
jgi:hypothetical protein